jgi:RHS repeat-associated protein
LALDIGNLISAQYYAAGQPFAYYLAADGHVRFEHQDWLGTERFRTTYTGAVEGTFTSLPFGDSTSTASGSDSDAYHYAALDADTTDLQYATFRQYSAIQGRWLRPDPYDGSYSLTDPQSMNRYAYVGNSPMSYGDPSGLLRPPCADDDDLCDLAVIGGGGYSFGATWNEFDAMNVPIVDLQYGLTPVGLAGDNIQSCGSNCIDWPGTMYQEG